MAFLYEKGAFNKYMTKNNALFLLLGLVFLIAAISGCFSSKKVEEVSEKNVPDMHTSKIALDWQGDYMGILPCADCKGIYTHIHLSASRKYQVLEHRLGRSSVVSLEQGTFEWTEDGNAIRLENKQILKVHEHALVHIDEEGDMIQEERSNLYRLSKAGVGPLKNKVSAALAKGEWQVYALLQGESEWWKSNQPTLNFDQKGNLSGKAQCNQYFASFSVPATQQLELGTVSSTKMACPKLGEERRFMEALGRTHFFIMVQDQLVLTNDEFLPLLAASCGGK